MVEDETEEAPGWYTGMVVIIIIAAAIVLLASSIIMKAGLFPWKAG